MNVFVLRESAEHDPHSGTNSTPHLGQTLTKKNPGGGGSKIIEKGKKRNFKNFETQLIPDRVW